MLRSTARTHHRAPVRATAARIAPPTRALAYRQKSVHSSTASLSSSGGRSSGRTLATRFPQARRWQSTSSFARAPLSHMHMPNYSSFSPLAIAAAMGLLYMISADSASAEEKDPESLRPEADEPEPPALETKYLIIGAGTTAMAAIKELKAIDPNAKIVVISEEFYLPYQRPPLTKELWRTNDPDVVTNLTFTDWEGKQSSVFYETDAFFTPENGVFFVRVDGNILLTPERHMIQLPDGSTITYEKALIATGAKPFARFPGDWQLGGAVTTYRNLEDFQSLYSTMKEGGKKIAIAGGGFLGSELAWALAKLDTKVKNEIVQIVPESGIMANLFPKYLSDNVTEKLREAGVDVMTGRMVKEIDTSTGKVNITLDNDATVAADHLVLAAGVIPDTRVAHFCELELDPVNKGILANSELQAGDVASYYDYFLGRRRVEHYEHAVESGRHAAKNMTGAKKPYTHIPMFWGSLGDDGYEAVGIIDSRLKTVSVWETKDGTQPIQPEYRRGSVYYIGKDNRVAGVLLWNMFGKVEDARAVIRRLKQFDNFEDLTWAISTDEKH